METERRRRREADIGAPKERGVGLFFFFSFLLPITYHFAL